MSSPPPPSHSSAPLPSRPELPEGVWRPEPPPAPPPRDDRAALPRWPLWSPFAGMLGALLVAVLGVGVIAIVVEAFGVDTSGDTPAGITIGGTYVQDLALIAAAVLLAARLDPPASPDKFGLRLPAVRPAIRWTLIAWASFFAVSAVWAQLLDISESDDLPQELGVDSSTAALVAVSVLVCVLAPIAEELFFRAFCFTALRRTLGMLPGAILTGMIFGAIHLGGTEIEFIVPLMVFGFFLCLLYAKTGSLLPCIVLHALNNALALGVSEDWGAAIPLAMAAAAAASVAIVLPFARRTERAVA